MLEANDSCPDILATTHKALSSANRVIIRSYPKQGSHNNIETRHHWQLAGALEGQGYIEFSEIHRYNELTLNNVWGIKDQPGSGNFLLESLRRAYPNQSIVGTLGHLNFNRARAAFLENPEKPNIEIIPMLRGLDALIELGPDYENYDEEFGAAITFRIYPLNKTPSDQSGIAWVNRRSVLSHRLYHDWLQYLLGEADETTENTLP